LIYKETEAFYQSTHISPELVELRNIITNAYLIVKSASIRKESRGLHFTTDYPNKAEIVMNTIL
jgi:L-aspartate oxidase